MVFLPLVGIFRRVKPPYAVRVVTRTSRHPGQFRFSGSRRSLAVSEYVRMTILVRRHLRFSRLQFGFSNITAARRVTNVSVLRGDKENAHGGKTYRCGGQVLGRLLHRQFLALKYIRRKRYWTVKQNGNVSSSGETVLYCLLESFIGFFFCIFAYVDGPRSTVIIFPIGDAVRCTNPNSTKNIYYIILFHYIVHVDEIGKTARVNRIR